MAGLAILLALVALVVAIVALVFAAHRPSPADDRPQVAELERHVAYLARELHEVRRHLTSTDAIAAAALRAAVPPAADAAPATDAARASSATSDGTTTTPAAPSGFAERDAFVGGRAVGVEAPVTGPMPAAPAQAARPTPAPRGPHEGPPRRDAVRPMGAPGTPPAGGAEAPRDVEQALGLKWVTGVGAAVLVVGLVFFYRYASARAWIGPGGRVALGVALGAGLIAVAEALRRRVHPVWTHIATGLGLAVLLGATYAAHALYGLVTVGMAFGLVTALVALGAALALRHDSEPLLCTAVAAGLANPALLRASDDDGVLFFGYLVVLTAGALAIAARQRWSWAAAVTCAGAAIVYALGASALLGLDAASTGSTRLAVALVALAIEFALFVAAAVRWGRSDMRRALLGLVPPLVVGASAALVQGATLAAATAAVTLATVATMAWLGETDLVVLPALAALAAPVGTALGREQQLSLALFALASTLPVAAAIGVRVFATDQRAVEDGDRRACSGRSQADVSLLFAATLATAAIHFAQTDPRAVATTALGVTMLIGAIGAVRAMPVVLVVVGVAVPTVGIVAVQVVGPTATLHPALAVAPCLAVFAAVLVHLARHGDDRPEHLAPLPLPALGLSAVLFVGIAPGVQSAASRNLVAVLVAAAVHAVAAAIAWRARPRAAPLLAATSAALLALAVPLGLEGHSVTAAWALMAAAAAVAARKTGLVPVTVAAYGLLALTLGHLLAADLGIPAAERQLFVATHGRQGAFTAPAFVGGRGLALASFGGAALVVAWATRKLRGVAELGRFVAVAGHLALVAYLATTAFDLVDGSVPAPATRGAAAFADAVARARDDLDALAPMRAVATSVVTGLYGVGLLIAGFALPDRFTRLLALGLLVATLTKLGAYDAWQLGQLYQMILMIALGVILLSSGLVYARFGRERLLAEDTGAGRTPKQGAPEDDAPDAPP